MCLKTKHIKQRVLDMHISDIYWIRFMFIADDFVSLVDPNSLFLSYLKKYFWDLIWIEINTKKSRNQLA